MDDASPTNCKDRLADILEKSMERRPLDDIRVVDLIREAHISKPTFYRHFQDKYDLLEYCFRRIYDETFGCIGPCFSFTDACFSVYGRYREKQAFLRCGYKSNDANGLVALERRLVRETYSGYLSSIGVIESAEISFALDLFVIGAVTLTKEWVLDGMPRSDKEQARLLLESMPANIAPLFR